MLAKNSTFQNIVSSLKRANFSQKAQFWILASKLMLSEPLSTFKFRLILKKNCVSVTLLHEFYVWLFPLQSIQAEKVDPIIQITFCIFRTDLPCQQKTKKASPLQPKSIERSGFSFQTTFDNTHRKPVDKNLINIFACLQQCTMCYLQNDLDSSILLHQKGYKLT